MAIINLYRKVKWFFQNYNTISYSQKLIPVNQIAVPNIFLGKITYATDSLVTSNNCDFINEEKFAKAYAVAAATKPWEGFTCQWRTYIVCWFANMVKNLEGDFVECGVNTGAFSRAIIEYTDFKNLNKAFFLLDTYEGADLSLITEKEKEIGIDVYLTHYKNVYEEVKETFKEFNVKIIKGAVPSTLKECTAQKISYLSLDLNSVEPEIAAMHYFWDKIVTGGVIILDDYGFPLHINQKIAFDEFVFTQNQQILTLPTGQGIIIKK